MKRLILSVPLAAMITFAASAESIELWSGNQAADWSGGLKVSTTPAYKKAGAGDVIHVDFERTGANPGIKLALFTPWTEINSQYNLPGDSYEYTLTDSDVQLLIPGAFTLQGQDLNFTRVTVTADHYTADDPELIPDPEPRDECQWLDMNTAWYFGTELKKRTEHTYTYQPKGAIGWYWEKPLDLTGCKSIKVEFGKQIDINMNLSVIYGDDPMQVYVEKILKSTTSKPTTEYTLDLTSAAATDGHDYSTVYAVALLSAASSKKDIEISSIKAFDADGKEFVPPHSGIGSILADGLPDNVIATEYFTLQGVRTLHPEGLVIVRHILSDRSVKTYKRLFSK